MVLLWSVLELDFLTDLYYFENTLSLRVAYFTVNVYVQCSQLDLLPYKLIYHKYLPIIVSVDLQQATDAVYRQ